MRRQRLLLAVGVLALTVGVILGIGYATAADPVNHGISFTKGCSSPTNVGAAYTCTYSIRNNVDDAFDTLTINGLSDVVHAASGDVPSGNVFSQLRFAVGPFLPGFSTPPSCTGGAGFSGTGTDANPWVGATSCSLPFGSRLNVLSFSYYQVTAADFNLAGHNLTDAASLTWHDVCDDPTHTGNSNCATNPPPVAAASKTVVTQQGATVATQIHDANHNVVTVVQGGTTVHDSATVSAPAGSPVPTGNVTLDWFTNNTCEGSANSSSGTFALVNGAVDATTFTKGPLAAGLYGFRAHYLGNPTYGPSDGPCEPLRVVDANIQITPPDATNRVGQQHTFTAHVNVNDGTGQVNAPDGTTISFTINGAPSGSCTTSGLTGSCSITLTSPTTTVWAVRASTTLSVGGLTLTRSTDGIAPNSGPAMKRWVNAKIAITPTATNEVGHPHTFTVTLQKDTGDGNGFVAAAGEHVNVTLTDSNGANHGGTATGTCTNSGPNTDAGGTCTITFSSPTAGKVTGHASATLSVAGSAPFTVETDNQGLNSGDAVKTYVDANIQITPSQATNAVGATHVFTAHVNVNNGNGLGFQSAPDGTQISFTKTGPGTFTTPNPCTVGGGTGSCQISLVSNTTGQTVVTAHVTLSVANLTITRDTDNTGSNSGPGVKNWAAARISIAPSQTNPVNAAHTFTVTLEKDTGTGTFVPAAGEHVNYTLTDANGAVSTLNGPASTCDDAGPNTNAAGQCTIVFNSSTPGTVTGHAFATLSIGGAVISVQTNGQDGNSPDAVKTYVDANIQITPATATNRIGTNHVLTAHVNVNTGNGVFQNAPIGTQISFSIDSGPGSFTTTNPCTVGDASGSCQITLTSSTTGVTVVSAHTTVSVNGVSLARNTNGTGLNSGPAVKTWVNARISITPNAVNEVGHSHTFTVLLQKDTGNGVFVPAAGEHVDASLANSNNAGFVLDAATSTCDDAGANTNAAGQCTLVFTSMTPGKVTGHASATLNIGTPPTSVTVATDGAGLNSGDAVKTFVDANIQITPATATNRVGVTHTFTAHVNVNDGSGNGFQNAPDGTQISFSIDSGPGGFTTPNPCTTAGGSGSCTIDLASSVTGVTVVSAHTTVSVGGVSLSRNTNNTGANSPPAQKTWVNARIAISPDDTNQIGQSHTFKVTLLEDTGTGVFVPAAGEHVDVTLTPAHGAVALNQTGTCLSAGANTDVNGQCTITFVSNTTGTITGHASSTLSIGTPPTSFNVQTDGLILNSGDAVKTYVNAKIAIAPDATNEVGHPHTFTVTLQKDPGTGTFEPAAGEHVNFTLTGANGAVPVVNNPASTCDDAGANTNASGQCTIVFNSTNPGQVTGHASSTLLVGPPPPAAITVETDGTGLNSRDAVKTYVDANIQITPANATNRVGTTHVLTAHVNVDDGTTPGFVNAPDGTQISFNIDSGPGSFTTPNPCVTSGGTGNCTITLSSSATGTTVVTATTNVVVGGLTLTRSTNGTAGNSGPADKTWVNARIAIAPTATNEVGHPHTFTVTLLKDTGTGTFGPAANEHVTVALTPSNGATLPNPATGTCTQPGANTDAAGQCTITFVSPTGGKVTGHASATLSIGTPPTTFTVQTDGTGLNSVDAVKTYVDANIQINPPTALNPVNTNHVFTAHMNVNDGTNGSQNAPAGTPITFTIVSGPGHFTTANPCFTVGTSGSCTITLTSSVTGTTVVSASGTVTLAGLQVSRTTDGQGANSVPAQKTWGSAQISIAPDATNEVGVPHTFTVTLTKDNGSGTQMPAAGEHVDVTLTPSNGATLPNPPTGTCTQAGANTNAQGQCTITFVSPTAGKVTGHAVSTLLVGGVSTTVQTVVDAVKTYVDANIQISPNGTNPIGTTHTFTAHVNINKGDGAGFVNAPAGTTISFNINSGPGSFTSPSSCTTVGATGSCDATITSSVAGATIVGASTTTSVGGVSLTRTTNGAGNNSGPATKVWVAARIRITPSATNEVGHPHTFTVTLEKDSGSGFGPAAGEHVDVTLTPSNGATLPTAATGTCTNGGTNTNGSGQCTITFVSPTAGKVTGHAAATLTVGGKMLTVQTDGLNGNSADAVKTYVDANIQISPPNATNRIGQMHTFTAHVNVLDGSGGSQNAPDNTTINFTINGTPSGNCQTSGGTGSCSITLTSATTGVWTVNASATLSVGGVSLTRTTNGVAPNSGPAIKTWVNATISIAPNATNRVGQPHTFTVTLMKDLGNGAGLVVAPNETVTVTLTNANGANATPSGPFTGTTNASGQFQVTFNSPTTGTVTGHASSTITLGTPPTTFTVQTNGQLGSSNDAVKTYVDARISIAPSATNEVGHAHTFTVTLEKDSGSGFGPAANEHVDVTLTPSNGATLPNQPTGTCTLAGANTNAQGQCTITFVSPTAGKVTGHATASLTIGGVPITVQTNGQAGNSADAVKTFVDANIQISPQTDTNPVNTDHVLTVHVNVNLGDGNGYVNAPAGTSITLTKVSGPGSFTTPNPCTTIGTTGSCTVTLRSATAGTTVVSASVTTSVGALTVTRTTNGTNGNSGNASKTWVNARISIAPTATNEIGAPHTFTVTLEKDSGSGFGPAQGEHVDVTLTTAKGATLPSLPSGSCTNSGANTNASGQCTITFASPTPGTVTGHATATLTIGGLPLTVATDGQNGNSADAVKTYVDANIQITPATANNPLNTNHVLTAHVNVNRGDGAGYVNAPANTTITFSIVSGPGNFVGGVNTCTTVGTTGECTATITSGTAGTTVVRAAVNVTLAGIVVHRQTADGKLGDSADAQKNWIPNVAITSVQHLRPNDSATVSPFSGSGGPTPTGNVTFRLYGPGDSNCQGTPAFTQTVPLSNGSASTNNPSFTMNTSGTWRWKASYAGDSNYEPSESPCGFESYTITNG